MVGGEGCTGGEGCREGVELLVGRGVPWQGLHTCLGEGHVGSLSLQPLCHSHLLLVPCRAGWDLLLCFLRLRALSNTTIRLCRILLSGFVEYCDRLSLIVPPKCPSLLAKQEAYCLWQLSPSGERVRGCCRGPRDIGSPVIKIAWFCQAQ